MRQALAGRSDVAQATYPNISKGSTGDVNVADPMPMSEALKQARQLRAGGHVNVIMRYSETNTGAPLNELDELD